MLDKFKRNWALMTPQKQKRTVMVTVILVFALGAWWTSVKTTPPKKPDDKLAVNVVAPPQRNIDLTDINAAVTALQRQMDDFNHRLDAQQAQSSHRLDQIEAAAQTKDKTSTAAPSQNGPTSALPAPGTDSGITPPGPMAGQPALSSALPGATGPGISPLPGTPGAQGGNAGQVGTTGDTDQPPADGIQIMGEQTAAPASGASATDSTKLADNKQMFLPMGSIMTGFAINGGDFPTTRASTRNPVPMLIRLKKDAILPSYQRASVKECFAMVSGSGELSTGRANLRAERLSCVLAGGRVVEVPLDGYVVGEDGKPGLRGNLASKDGAVIANAMRVALIGAAGEGIATIVSNEVSNIHSSGVNVQFGSNSSNGQQMAAPIGTAFQNIAQYYTDLAKEIVPVVEINPLRRVDIILVKGVSLPL